MFERCPVLVTKLLGHFYTYPHRNMLTIYYKVKEKVAEEYTGINPFGRNNTYTNMQLHRLEREKSCPNDKAVEDHGPDRP